MYTDPEEKRDYRKWRRELWGRDAAAHTAEKVEWLKKIVAEAKKETEGYSSFIHYQGFGTVIAGEEREFTKGEFQKLRELNYSNEIYLYYGAKLAKAEHEDYTRVETGVALRRAPPIWKKFISGEIPSELKVLLGSQLAVETTAAAAKAKAAARPAVLYTCTRCGRVMANPIPGDRTCRGTQLHAWITKDSSPT